MIIDDVIAGIVSTIDNQKAIRKIYVLQGPKEYTFINLVKVLEIKLKRKALKVYMPVFVAKWLAYFLYLLQSDKLYRDQIDRLLPLTVYDADHSFDDLGIKPKALEETIKFI